MPSPTGNVTSLFEKFAASLALAGGEAIRVPELADVAALVGDADAAWVSPVATAAFPALAEVLAQAGVRVLIPDDPATVRDAPLGITVARLAIAETGSVLLHEPDLAGRTVSLMTQRLVVLCRTRDVVPTLDEAAPVLREIAQAGPSYATFVTGPSRTADIERELAIGVQGPGVVQVVFVDDAP